MITPAQLYYITRVYPEKLTVEEAQKIYDHRCCTPHLTTYWEAAAKLVNELATVEALQLLECFVNENDKPCGHFGHVDIMVLGESYDEALAYLKEFKEK